MTYETFDQSDEKTWPDQKIPTYLHTYPLTYLPTYLCTSIREQPIGAIIGTCDIWDTDYITDNWEPGFMTIIVTWQLIVTLDSIRNSCDVFSRTVFMLRESSQSAPAFLFVANFVIPFLFVWSHLLSVFDRGQTENNHSVLGKVQKNMNKGTPNYLEVPQSTEKYIEVHRCTSKYIEVLQST